MLAKELVDHDNAFFKNKNKSSYRGGNGIPVLLGVELWVLRQRRLDLADARPPASGHLWPSARLPWTYRGRLASWVSLPGVTPARDWLVQGKVWKPSFPAMCQDALWGITPSPVLPMESGRTPAVRLRPLGLGFSLSVHFPDSTHICDKPHTGTPKLESASVSKFSFFREKC